MSDIPSRLPARPSLEQLRKRAKDLLRAYRAGDAAATERFRAVSPRLDTATLTDAQFVLAREHGFESWAKLKHGVEENDRPRNRINWKENTIEPGVLVSDKDWDDVFAVMKERAITGLNAGGRMTDAVLERLSKVDHVTRLDLGGSLQLTDAGLAHLARMPQLRELDVSGWKGRITDRGLEVLRYLPELRRFQMCWQQNVSDAGLADLAFCDHLESVNLMGTPCGDGAIQALAGKPRLRQFKTGRGVSDAGLPFLHRFPAFMTWRGRDIRYSLMSAEAEPTHLLLDGPFTNAGLASLAGLDGLFALSFFWHSSAFTAEGLGSLADLANLGFLGCGETRCDDDAMRQIAKMPKLRMLMAQGAVASDAGFAALSRSQTIEYLWGRECPNLTGRGFVAMAAMPALRGLAVSCKDMDDAALSTLPRFPALREFMPMDVPDEGFRHVGRCEHLEALWCMYCRDTGDAATNHIAGLSRLKSYYAGKTLITDSSLETLGRMPSLERLEFWQCTEITDAGVAQLAGLPRLREVTIGGSPNVSREGAAVFPGKVLVNYES
jgi:hypothetical protein